MNSRRTFTRMGWHLVLALVMLLMQQAGLRHSLEHVAHDDDAAPTHAACLLCAAHHAQGHAIGGETPVVPAPRLAHVQHTSVAHAQCRPTVQPGYLSRAPPLSLSV